jgi:predicted nucleic acid-binding protein
MSVYVDSSAVVKLVVKEPESHALRSYLSAVGPLATSILTTVEVPRAVARVAPTAAEGATAVLAAMAVIGFDSALASRAAALGPASLRALDAIHLATALELVGDLSAFVCYDERLAAAARSLGLPVVAPA